MITLSLDQLLALVDGDDSLSAEKSWLLRNTFASAECTVIPEILALNIIKLDPESTKIHIEVYTIPETTLKVYTLWTPITWHESREKIRIHRAAHSEWRESQLLKTKCKELVTDFVLQVSIRRRIDT